MGTVVITDKIHEWSKKKARDKDVEQEGLVGVLLVLALNHEQMVNQAVGIMKQYGFGGATVMQNKGW